MAPKAKDALPQAVPDPEDEVELPPGLAAGFAEPEFGLVLATVQGHSFVIDDPAVEEGADPERTVDFDPGALLIARAKQVEDPLLKKIAVVERAELQAAADADGSGLMSALRVRLQRERLARERAKSNAARRAAIDAYNAREEEGGAEEQAPPPVNRRGSVTGTAAAPQADFVLVLKDFPVNTEEMQELAAENFLRDGVVDLLTHVYLAGETLQDGSGSPQVGCEAPELVSALYDAIHEAPVGTDMANTTVTTIYDTQELAGEPLSGPDGLSQADRVTNVVLRKLAMEVQLYQRYRKWMKEPTVVKVPKVEEAVPETRLYSRLMSSVDPSHHDVPLFLHCLTEQVQLDLGGGGETVQSPADELEDQIALCDLEQFLGLAREGTLAGGSSGAPRPTLGPVSRPITGGQQRALATQRAESVSPAPPVQLSALDESACAHHLAGGGAKSQLLGDAGNAAGQVRERQPVVDAAREILDFVSVPGHLRSMLPSSASHSAGARAALRSRLQPFAPMISPPELEQMCMQKAFEELMSRAQPERKWHLRDRTVRERISKRLLQQTLAKAFRSEWLTDTAYLPRYDCLLLAVHQRAMQGGLLFHSWRGDLLQDPQDQDRWNSGMFTQPTFNDWSQVLYWRGGEGPKPRFFIDAMDSRQMGYATVREKLITPADGSAILSTKLELGLEKAFKPPSNTQPHIEVPETLTAYEAQSCAASEAPSAVGALDQQDRRYDAPARSTSVLTKVMKAGLSFGMVNDADWSRWLVAGDDRTEALKDMQLGSLWLALPGGARCTARMHHEMATTQPAPEKLVPFGTLVTYTMACGQVIQVFADGAVRLSWPLHFRQGGGVDAAYAASSEEASAAGETPPQSNKGSQPQPLRVSAEGFGFQPGCEEDVERSRTVMPFGTIVRKLMSGRLEVLHPDGTVAVRNPTTPELEGHIKSLSAAGVRPHCLEILARLLQGEKERTAKLRAALATGAPTAAQKKAGLPGHWVVYRTDGKVFGRCSASEAPFGGALEDTPAAQRPLSELLGGKTVGDLVEYEIEPISVALQEDLDTKHKTFTNERGMAMFEDPAEIQRACIHPEGTQVVRTNRDGGYDTKVIKEPYAYVRCVVDGGSVAIHVECADGARLVVQPQRQRGGQAAPLAADDPDFDALSTHARVTLSTRDGVELVSSGAGEVQFSIGESGDAEAASYVALCHENRLCVRDPEGEEFELLGDQTVKMTSIEAKADIDIKSPRCIAQKQACIARGTEKIAVPSSVPPPRLFAIYGDGNMEELLPADEATSILEAARKNPESQVVTEPLWAEAPDCGCFSHTVFSTRVADTPVVPLDAPIAVPLNVEMVRCVYTSATARLTTQAKVRPPSITEVRQFVEYPAPQPDFEAKFRGTLKQYRQWEYELLVKIRDMTAGPAAKGKKKDDGGAKVEKEKKKGKKGKRRAQEQEESAEQAPPDPTFVDDLKLTLFEHEVLSMRYRAATRSEPATQALLDAASAVRAKTVQALLEEEVAADALGPSGLGVAGLAPEDVLGLAEEPESATGKPESAAVSPEAPKDKTLRKSTRSDVNVDPPVFAFFESSYGLQCLEEIRRAGGERHLAGRGEKAKGETNRRPMAGAIQARGPWNPRLVGEPAPEPPASADVYSSNFSAAEEPQARPDSRQPDYQQPAASFGYSMDQSMTQGQADNMGATQPEPGYPSQRGDYPIVPERQPTPKGAHPDKRGPEWDVYGEEKPPRKPVSQAHVQINRNYLEVEGATDRRVRTSSVAQKKNATKAPSVSWVRKTGIHAIGRTPDMGAKDILGEECDVNEHWKLSSTMQGLGNSEQLVDVRPGKLRFGPLRRGWLYRMSFWFRNLDVDVTRYSVTKVKSEFKFVHVDYKPGHLAPGIAARVDVYIAARAPAKVEQVVEVQVKAHIVQVPVTARILDAEEYDRLDHESLALHGSRIGRHLERSESNKPGPVELVTDESWCRKLLGDDYDYVPAPAFDAS